MKEWKIYERFFQIPNYSQKVPKQCQQECMLLWKAGGHFFYYVNKYYLVVQFVICQINDNNSFRFKQFFDKFLKYLCFLFIMTGGLINC